MGKGEVAGRVADLRRRMVVRTCLVFAGSLGATTVDAWSEAGHHVVALLAYDLMTFEEQKQLGDILSRHPRYAEDFRPPSNVAHKDRWRIGNAGYWPDEAGRRHGYERRTWHFELSAIHTVGSVPSVPAPGPLPREATLETQGLYILQATTLCRQILADPRADAGDRAIALCWVTCLVADVHQPCNAGGLYAENLYPEGDDCGRKIKTEPGGNLHRFWDCLLGDGFEEEEVERQIRQARQPDLVSLCERMSRIKGATEPSVGLAESGGYANSTVYQSEILARVRAVSEGQLSTMPLVVLSDSYKRWAASTARRRAMQGSCRLAAIWREALQASASK